MGNVGLDLPCEALVPMRIILCLDFFSFPPLILFRLVHGYSFELLHRFRFIAWRILPYDSFNENIVRLLSTSSHM
jgi:hypothetical protein